MNRQGFLYVTSLGLVALLAIACASLLIRSSSELSLSEYTERQLVAFHLAEAGVDQAARNLRTPTDLTDDVTAGTLPTGSFTIDAPPQSLGNSLWKITAHGRSIKDASHTRDVEAVFQLTPQSVFQFALFGDQNINVSGSGNTDSYTSNLYLKDANGNYILDGDGKKIPVPYGGCLISPCPGSNPPINVSKNGDIGTNSKAPGGVTLTGSIFIDGQVAVGPGVADPTSVVTGYNPAFISGDPKVASQSNVFPMLDVTVPAGLTCNDYTVQGNKTVTLAPGTYCYHDLTIQGGGTLTSGTSSGPVTIYLTGALIAKGNSIVGYANDPKRGGNESQFDYAKDVGNPTAMAFLMSSTGEATLEEGTLTGSTEFYGLLYGPKATIKISGNAKVFGSIIAKTVNLTGSAEIHYDGAMTHLYVSNLYATKMISWRDLN